MRLELIIANGEQHGQTFDLADGRTLRIGRNSDMEITLSAQGVSRRHCQVFRKRDDAWIEDLGSRNGTAVSNIPRIAAPHLLQSDDVIRLSDTMLIFRQYGPMTEAQWLADANADRLAEEMRRRFGPRKLRLFALACCRSLPGFGYGPTARDALLELQQFADGNATFNAGQVEAALVCLGAVGGYIARLFMPDREFRPPQSNWPNLPVGQEPLIEFDADHPYHDFPFNRCDLIRELCGNPFHRIVVDPNWANWNAGSVGKLARMIYDKERFADMPILADALADAGCDEGQLVEHLRRQPGNHIPGCWALDWLLGRHLAIQ